MLEEKEKIVNKALDNTTNLGKNIQTKDIGILKSLINKIANQ